MKKFLFGLFTFLIIFVFTFLFLEAGFRFFRPEDSHLQKIIGTFNSNLPYLFEPNQTYTTASHKGDEFEVTVNVNSLGYRGKEFSREKPKDKLRLFVTGDSFTFGVGAEDNETIPALLEQALLQQQYPVEVINAGIGHASTLSHYLHTRDIHLQYKPDLVVLLFDFSDLQDDWRDERSAVKDKEGNIRYLDPSFENGKRNWWKFLVYRSVFCKYLHNKLVRTFQKIQTLGLKNYVRAKLEGKRAKSLIVNQNKVGQETIAYDKYLMIRGRHKLDEIKPHWKRTSQYLLQLHDLLAKRDIPMILVTYPYGIHVGPNQWGSGRVFWGFEKGKTYDDPYAFELIETFANKNKIPFINTFPAFQAAANQTLFFDLDGHLNPAGNKVLTEAIMKNPAFLEQLHKMKQPTNA